MSKQDDGVDCKNQLCAFSSLDEVTTNDDLLIEILLWLPTKSLTRFKLVSKRWLSLIATHRFSHLHTIRHPKLQHSLLMRTRLSKEFFYFHPTARKAQLRLVPYHISIPRTKILSSSNGLLLLESDLPIKDPIAYYNPYNLTKEYYVYNPTTRQSRKISFTYNHEDSNILALILAFDPSKSPHYKIVCIRSPTYLYPHFSMSTRTCPIDLYDSETLTGRKIGSQTFYGMWLRFDLSTERFYWNNVIHWGNPPTHKYYDMEKLIFKDLPLAQIPSHGYVNASYRYQLQESDGRLYQFIIIHAPQWNSIAIYELQADYSKWLLLYHHAFSRYEDYLHILSFVRGDGEETSTLVFHVPGKIVAYRFSDMSCNELVDLKDGPLYQNYTFQEYKTQFDCRDVYQFGETLANV